MSDTNGAANGVATAEVIDLSLMEPIFETYAGERGALIPILQRAQEIYNYLPPEVLSSSPAVWGCQSARSTGWRRSMPSSISSGAAGTSSSCATALPATSRARRC